MITPTKGVSPQRALLSVGAQVASVLDTTPLTVSQTWHRLKEWRRENHHNAPISFEWFALSLDLLFTLGTVQFDGGLLHLRRADADRTPRQR